MPTAHSTDLDNFQELFKLMTPLPTTCEKKLLPQISYCKFSVQNLRVVLIWAFNWNIFNEFLLTLNQEE